MFFFLSSSNFASPLGCWPTKYHAISFFFSLFSLSQHQSSCGESVCARNGQSNAARLRGRWGPPHPSAAVRRRHGVEPPSVSPCVLASTGGRGCSVTSVSRDVFESGRWERSNGGRALLSAPVRQRPRTGLGL